MEKADHGGNQHLGHQIERTTYDKIMRAWENSMELTRDFEVYAKQISDNEKAARMFRAFAEDEGHHASRLREMLHQYQDGGNMDGRQ
ncbi:MAG: rubrerythrin [Clostridia bacterium]|nr:rubrerythrin [Clostridia bacterium]